MDMKFSTVVEYVKNLFPGCAPVKISDNPTADALAVAYLAHGIPFFTTAGNGLSYWYCFVFNPDNRKIVKSILKNNGVKVFEHKSNYFRDGAIVLRARRSFLRKHPDAMSFVEDVMRHNPVGLDKCAAEKRVAEIQARMKQKVK